MNRRAHIKKLMALGAASVAPGSTGLRHANGASAKGRQP